jgi:23S rRNA (cytidine1920-2'-O)/16S rRNA (cytidine1409-2'-O)-methyltransferase
VGASTGGFTDCLLQNGAGRVYAIDVGQGILHWKIRQDERVVVMENTNARYLKNLPKAVDLVTIDASFISLKILLPIIQNWLAPQEGNVLALIKPQFEAGRAEVSKGSGVIRQPSVHRQVLLDVLSFSQGIHYGVQELLRSPLLGPKGNVEFFTWLVYPGQARGDLAEMINQVMGEG